ncbi:MAG: hypothetical protein QOH13_457, partial [Thermoleophilaceae bacterium]|nr:hypothetical protein [Thermoleophilaceae bacterium]
VSVDNPVAAQNGIPVTAKGAYTAANGTYSVTGLAPGSYKVEFKDCFSGQGFLTKWFNGKGDFASATTVGPLAAGDSVTRDQALDKGSSIAGSVTGTGGTPLANVCVEAYDPAGTGLAGPTVAATTTNGSGNYKLTPLIGGDYKVRFRDCAFSPSYAAEWFDNKADFASADVVTVAPGADVTGKDAVLAAGGHIAGRVTDGTNPIEHICLRATQDVSDPYAPVAFAQSAANGSFDLTTLPAGQYVLEITDCNTVGYVGRFWDDKETSVAADRITVTAGSTANLPHDVILVTANDTTPPDTSLTAAPSGTITTTSARFDYLSNEPLVTFICSITKQDGSPQTVSCPAGNPFGNHVTVENLSDGTYTFSAAARDRGNNQDATPVTATFTVATASDTAGGTVTEPVTTPAPVATPSPPSPPSPAAVKCVVPKLIGLTLKAAKKALAKRHCRLGKVTKSKAKRSTKKPRKGTVIAQRPKRGSQRPAGSKVALVLAK